MSEEYKKYRRTNIAEIKPYSPNLFMGRVSISQVDKDAGSPKLGDMIARNPNNHNDVWLVAANYFQENFEEVV